jgi:hypothetical protein
MIEYKKGQRDVLVALFDDPTIDSTDLRFAAYENRKISKSVVDEAIENANTYGNNNE